jgi:hypothetical protein
MATSLIKETTITLKQTDMEKTNQRSTLTSAIIRYMMKEKGTKYFRAKYMICSMLILNFMVIGLAILLFLILGPIYLSSTAPITADRMAPNADLTDGFVKISIILIVFMLFNVISYKSVNKVISKIYRVNIQLENLSRITD